MRNGQLMMDLAKAVPLAESLLSTSQRLKIGRGLEPVSDQDNQGNILECQPSGLPPADTAQEFYLGHRNSIVPEILT